MRRASLFVQCRRVALAATLATAAHASDAAHGADAADPDAAEHFASAEAAARAGLYDKCADAASASLAIAERLDVRARLLDCQERAGKIKDALRTIRVVLDEALATNDAELAALAAARTEQLLGRLGHVLLLPPSGARDLSVTFDDAVVPPARLGRAFPVDPGIHQVHAEGAVDGAPTTFDAMLDVSAGAPRTIAIALRARAPEFLTVGQVGCLHAAGNQEEVMRCFPRGDKSLVARAALAFSAYADTLAVRVVSPEVSGLVASPTAGWNVGARYLIDVVSAASPDFVSSASRRGKDTRQAGSVSGGCKPGRFGADASASFSTEADYVSRSASLSVSGDLANKQITPRLGWSTSYDTISRGGTPTSVFSNTLWSNEASVGATLVLSPASLLVVGGTASFQRGDQSKPYRLIPMFGPSVTVPAGASADLVNATRLPLRPYEQLPLARDRYALAARFAHRFKASTLRLEQRVYRDTWAVAATTTDVRHVFDLGAHLSVWPHLRAHAQTAAVFYRRVYHAEVGPEIAVPDLRTTDRELSPFVALTAGLGARVRIGADNAHVRYGLVFSGDVMQARYLSSLYITDKTAVYGTIGAEVELE